MKSEDIKYSVRADRGHTSRVFFLFATGCDNLLHGMATRSSRAQVTRTPITCTLSPWRFSCLALGGSICRMSRIV